MWTTHMQAVILAAGRGSRMTELLGNQIPKCLIPIGGNPLIFYPLKALADCGFKGKDVLVIIQEKDNDVRKAIDAAADKAGLKVDKFCIPEDSEDFGTAESIRIALQSKKIIQKDVLIISCDLIGELPLSDLVKIHGLKNSSCTALFMKSVPLPATSLPGPKNKSKPERDILGVKLDTSEMVMLASEADLDDDLPIPVTTLKHYPSFKIITNLTDTHCYIVKKKLLEQLLDPDVDEDSKHISLKGEFIPYLIQDQFEPQVIKALGKMSFYCLVEQEKNCIRINSIRNYALINQSTDWLKSIFGNNVSRSKETKIGKGCKLITAALGDHSNVGEKVKLTNVIGMDHVTIEAGCEIQNTIISSNALIGENSFVKDCLVGPKYHVAAGARHVNEHLTVVEEALFEA